MAKLIENLTEKGLVYAIIGTTIRVYSWTLFAILLYLFYRLFKIHFNDKNFKIHKLFLFLIPLSLANAIIYSLKIGTEEGIMSVDTIIFILGIVILIIFLSIYSYFKGRVRR